MLHTSSRKGASATRRFGKRSLLQLLINLIEGDPTADKERMFHKWRAEIIDDPEDVDAALLHCFTNLWETLQKDRQAPQRRKPIVRSREERQAQVNALKERIVQKVLTLNFVMPNGKRLADCTGTEVSRYGIIFAAIARKAGKQLVGAVFKTDRQLLTAGEP
jgi:hypothetical protein